MNTVTHQEVHALEAAVPAQHMLLVPLSRLRFSRRNVRTAKPGSRKARRKFIRALAASLQHVGLLQNLTVIPCGEAGDYEVVAGSGRLEALQLLASKQVIAADYQVPCLLVADASARTASLTENVLRESMGLVAELRAWQALVDEGRTVEAIAADFGVAPLVVRRRLRLANVSPRLLASYEAEDEAESVSVEQLMALAITDDHAAQEAAFFDAPHWQRSPQALSVRGRCRHAGVGT